MNTELIRNHVYFMHEKRTKESETNVYRARYLCIVRDYIICDRCDIELSPKTVLYTPYRWITRVEKLEDILLAPTFNLPLDIIRVIDSFL
jgi:hypothetical protein